MPHDERLTRDSVLYVLQVDRMRDRLAEQGNCPAGMSLCEVAGMNGDAPPGLGCPFVGEDFCHCDPIDEEN
jgi:hypothetical protein